jgi:hypothetical protein
VRTFAYIVRIHAGTTSDIGGFLDMMRYDRAIVRTWSVETDQGRPFYAVTIETPRPATLDRWHSFDLYPKPQEGAPHPPRERSAFDSDPVYRSSMKDAGRGDQLG